MEDRCEHLAAEMGKRKRALLTLDWEILPGRANDARAARIAAAVREQFDVVNGFEDLLMDLADPPTCKPCTNRSSTSARAA